MFNPREKTSEEVNAYMKRQRASGVVGENGYLEIPVVCCCYYNEADPRSCPKTTPPCGPTYDV